MSKENTKASILLVEDEENLHDALKLNLELEGYEVSSAYDGSNAVKAVQAEYFDLTGLLATFCCCSIIDIVLFFQYQ